MPAFHPRVEELPGELAIFPLSGALLLPQGRLPLNIFEPRYLAMVEDSLGAGRMLAMVLPDPSHTREGQETGLYHVGCVGRLSSFAETDDGRFLITLSGVIRCRIAAEVGMRHGYRRVRADYAPYHDDLLVGRTVADMDRDALLGSLRAYFAARGFRANWDAIKEMPDDMLLVTLCMACPFADAEKQALLEAATDSERARVLSALLEMEAHGHADGDDAPKIS